jgi:hypothetical protein
MDNGMVNGITKKIVTFGVERSERIKPEILKMVLKDGQYVSKKDGVITLGIKTSNNRVAFITFNKQQTEKLARAVADGSQDKVVCQFTSVLAQVGWDGIGAVIGKNSGTTPYYSEIVNAIEQNKYAKAAGLFMKTPGLDLFKNTSSSTGGLYCK